MMSSTKAIPIVRADGEGELLSFYGGGLLTMKATDAETGGAFLLFEDVLVGGKATPLHVHANEDETMYVLEGEILMHIDGEEHRVEQYGVAMVPRGIPHAFFVVSKTARLLTLQTPGSAEAFYRMASQPATTTTDPAGSIDMSKVIEAGEKTGGMKVVGPPPFVTKVNG
jgi:quercetin dioxygenase-like cupin family protein